MTNYYCLECEEPIHYTSDVQGGLIRLYEKCSCGKDIIGTIKIEKDRVIIVFEKDAKTYNNNNELIESCTLFPHGCRSCALKEFCTYYPLRWREIYDDL